MIEFLKRLDRRWIFLVILLSAVLPMIFPLKLPTVPGTDTNSMYRELQALPPGSIVLMSFDYGPSTKVELEPAATAALTHLWRGNRDIKVVGMALWPDGGPLGRTAFKKVLADLEKEGVKKTYGVDYVNLGYKAGGVVALRTIGNTGGFPGAFPKDLEGTPVSEIPLMKQARKYRDLAMIVTLSGGDPGIKHHIQVGASQYGLKVSGGVTAVSAPEMSPYLNSGQLVGLMGGLRGAAEYEVLLNINGEALKGMNVQSSVHMMMVILIILSNVVYFADRRNARR